MKNNHPVIPDKPALEYLRIKRTLLACMVLVPFVPFLMVLLTGYYYFSSSLEKSTFDGMKRILRDHQTIVASFLKERKASLHLILNTNDIEALCRPRYLEKIYQNLTQNDQAVTDIGIFDSWGNHLAYQGPYQYLLGKSYRETEWFQAVKQNGHFVSDVFLGYRNAPHFIIAVARNISGKPYFLRATIDMQIFNELVKTVHLGKTGESFIVNQDGILQTWNASPGAILTKAAYDLPPASDAGEPVISIQKAADGKKYIYASVRMKDKNWLLVVKQELKDAFHALRQTIRLTVLIAVFGGGLIVGVAVYLTNRIVQTLTSLQAEKSSAQHQLIRAGRLSEMGQMAAGFAHEINNPLQIITGEQALIRSYVDEMISNGDIHPSEMMAEVSDSIDQIKVQVDRCAKTTRAILKFARKDEPKIEPVDLKSLVPEIVSLVERKAQVNGIEISQNLAADLPEIASDASQVQQVLLNLLNNGIDAITEKKDKTRGLLTVSLSRGPDDQVLISVSDNGVGIDDADKDKIFSPFFTTKPPGKGTGLGLSVCFAIIQSMGGTLSYTSEKGSGSTFTVRLPVT